MKYSSVGAVIAAASKKTAVPLLQAGSISILSRIVLTMKQADVFPIVIVTGTREDEVIHQMAKLGVIFLRNEACEAPELFDSVKIGLSFLQGKCDRVLFTPVNTPMCKPETLRSILAENAEIVVPSNNGKGGHPIVLRDSVIPDILAYRGEKGLRGAIGSMSERRKWVSVEDPGILVGAHNQEALHREVYPHNHAILGPNIKIGISRESVFFDDRLKLLLFLIEDLGTVRCACDHMGLSYQKAWDMVNRLEREVGCRIVNRKQGGSGGGRTSLTTQGVRLMYDYQRFETCVNQFARRCFGKIFQSDNFR